MNKTKIIYTIAFSCLLAQNQQSLAENSANHTPVNDGAAEIKETKNIENNWLREKCKFSNLDAGSFITKNSMLTSKIGNVKKIDSGSVEIGKILYYADFNEVTQNSKTYFFAKSTIHLKNTSPFNPDVSYPEGQKFISHFKYNDNKSGEIFDAILVTRYGQYMLVDKDGYICSGDYIKNEWVRPPLWFYKAYQEFPMERKIETTEYTGKKRGVAIRLANADELQTVLQIAEIDNEKITSKKDIAFNTMSGKATIEDFELKFHFKDGQFFVDSLATPSDHLMLLRSPQLRQ